MDETGVVYNVLPTRSHVVKNTDCAGGKRSKERITVSLAVNMAGEFDQPIVLGHAFKPSCFRNLDPSKLPVKWHANKKAWMTSKVFIT